MDRGRKRNQNHVRNHQNCRNNSRNENNNTIQKNDNGPSAKKRQNVATKPIGYRTLETVLQIENDAEFILKLSSKMNGFLILLDQPSIRTDVMFLILSALAKASKCSTELSTTQLLAHFYMELIPKLNSKSNFHREIKLYVAGLGNHFAIYSGIHHQKHVDAIQNLLTFLRRMQLTLYQKSFDAIRDLMQLITAQIEFINRKGNALNDYIVDTINQLNEAIENYDDMKMETEKTEILLEPPDDFRQISIYPDTFDILSTQNPFIRKNIIDGRYTAGIDHYLDIQFRLLREDFVRSLREGITSYRDIRNKAEQQVATPKLRIKDLNIYQDVHILGSKMLHNEQVHSCRFDCKPFRNIRWQVNAISSSFCLFSSFFS